MNTNASIWKALLATTFLGTIAAPICSAQTNYSLLTTIPIPATQSNNQGGALTGFDISYVDSLTGIYYLADRSNASVDIINGATNKVIGQAVGFVGQLSATSISGPDGVVVVNNGTTATLYAGDGNSTLRSFNVTNPSNPIALGTVNTGGGQFRVDEMAYSPTTNQIFTANNANSPAFASLINATPPAPTLARTNLLVPGQVAGGGLEQPVWNPHTGTFFVSVSTFNGHDAGGLQEFSATGTALRTYNFTNLGIGAYSPAGLALGASGNLLVGAGTVGAQTVVFNPAGNGGTGSVVKVIPGISGTDEVWYDPASHNFSITGVNAAGHRVIAIVSDRDNTVLQVIDLTALGAGNVNAHSVAVDPLNGEIFVPLEGSTAGLPDTLLPNGGIAVFAQDVPEPSTLLLLSVALAGVMGLAGVARRAV